MATLYLVRGIPGAGKSTFAKHMFPGIFHLENDMWHMRDGEYKWHGDNMKKAMSWCYNMVRIALEEGMDVVVSNTLTKKRFIAAYEALARENDASFKVYRCIGNFKNEHGLDAEMVSNFANSMEDWPGEEVVDPLWLSEHIKQRSMMLEEDSYYANCISPNLMS